MEIEQLFDKHFSGTHYADITEEMINNFAKKWAFANKLWGCYSGGKLLRIYKTKEEAEEAAPRWSAPYPVIVRYVEVGDGA